MTTSSSSSTSTAASAVSTSSIDVASIVSQLMTVENKPLDDLKAKITGVQTIISDLGNMKSKIATLQSAVTTFEDPSTYNNPTANSSDNSVVTASASTNAAIGSVSVSVSQLATTSKLVLTKGVATNFSSANDAVSIDPANGFSITVGGKIYNTKDTSNPLVMTGNNGGSSFATVSDLQNWINGLGVNVSANLIQTVSANDYVLQINGTQTGSANAVSLTLGAGSTAQQSSVSTAQDAIATIGGVTVNRSTNSINDVVNGITFNLVGVSSSGSSATISVAQGPDNSSAMINTLIQAYNDVVNQYNTYTANSNSGTSTTTTNGDFANDPTMLSYVNNIKSMFAYGATDTSSAKISGYSSANDSANIDTTNGYLQINSVKYNFSSIGQSNPTVTQLVSWVNGLNAGVTASFDGSSIQLKNSQTGGSNSIDLAGMKNSVSRSTVSLASMGMDLQLDGTIQFNTTTYQQSASNGLYNQLAKGLKLGFAGNGSSLDSFFNAEVSANGTIAQQITTQQSSITDLQKKQSELQDHLNNVQNNYITQYSALNALLFQLNSTSTSLASALLAVTNINAGN